MNVLCDALRHERHSGDRFASKDPFYSERSAAALVGRAGALRCGRGGIQRLVEASGLSKPTVPRGVRELRAKRKLADQQGRVRKPGGGRKPVEEHDPEITRLLEEVIEEST